jgi:hypothetical protein
MQAVARVVSGRSKEESSLDQELAEFNMVIQVLYGFMASIAVL